MLHVYIYSFYIKHCINALENRKKKREKKPKKEL